MIGCAGIIASLVCALMKVCDQIHWTWMGVLAPMALGAMLEALIRNDVLGYIISSDFLDSLSDADFDD